MFYLILSTILLALSFGLIKENLTTIPSETVSFLRLFLASLLFLPFLRKMPSKKCLLAFAIGIIQFGIMYTCYINAFQYLRGYEIALLTTSTPFLVAICACIFGERFKLKYLLCILLSIIGAVIVVYNHTEIRFILKGIIFMEMSNISFALGQVLWKKYVNDNSLTYMSTAYIGAMFFVLPFAFPSLGNLSLSSNQVLSIMYLGLIPTGIGFWLWNKGLKTVSVPTIAVMNNLKIPIGVFFAITIFHESVSIINFSIGGALILSAIICSYFFTKDMSK